MKIKDKGNGKCYELQQNVVFGSNTLMILGEQTETKEKFWLQIHHYQDRFQAIKESTPTPTLFQDINFINENSFMACVTTWTSKGHTICIPKYHITKIQINGEDVNLYFRFSEQVILKPITDKPQGQLWINYVNSKGQMIKTQQYLLSNISLSCNMNINRQGKLLQRKLTAKIIPRFN